MSTIDIAWASGLFEGEGCILTKRYGIKLKMTDLDVVRRFQSVMGIGSIIPAKQPLPHHKLCYEWAVWNKAGVYRLLELMLPYFGERRAYAALNKLDQIDGC